MKYIKKFENSDNSDKLYWIIDDHEYCDNIDITGIYDELVYKNDYVDFTNDEVSEIKKALPYNKVSFSVIGGVTTSCVLDINKKYESFFPGYTYAPSGVINKLNDEWFYVHALPDYFFKCDTFEGLMQLLIDGKKLFNN